MKTKLLLIVSLSVALMATAQKKAPQNWFNLDPKQQKTMGVSSDRAYKELLPGKNPKTIIVAVIDGGTDNLHEDLKDVLWTNTDEIPDNGIDDDKNGYVDDIHGWNFIGGPKGDVNEDNLEITRYYALLQKHYKSNTLDSLNISYATYNAVKKDFETRLATAKNQYNQYVQIDKGIDQVLQTLATNTPTTEQLKSYKPTGSGDAIAQQVLLNTAKAKMTPQELKNELKEAVNHFKAQVDFHYNTSLDTRSLVGDHYDNPNERYYGNNHYKGPEAGHGTHVAGIIAANRNNGIGIAGVSASAQIMIVRVVPNGDERDKDVANAIRYAVDNGAQIINMSFGKSISPQKSVVDEAVMYAVSRNVLLVHAAGNDHKNNDSVPSYPNRYYQAKDTASTWVEIGASAWKNGATLPADFSNYGATTVDIFAPGVDINSTLPDNTYGENSGTSMAAPVFSGVAALVWSYYPSLTAVELKSVLLNSAIPIKGKVVVPGSKKRKVKMKVLCNTGGVVNAYSALLYAEKQYGTKK